jgi:putative RecB family exonuclease
MTETVRRTIISFSQLDQYIRCPLKYRFMYVDRVDPEWIPAALIFGRGIDTAAAHYFRGAAAGAPPSLADVQDVFASYWDLETSLREVKFWKGSKAELLDQGARMLAVFHPAQDPTTEIVDVQRRLTVPLIDQQTGEVLDRELMVVMDLLERDREGHLVVVDLKTAARKYTELQVETSLQLTVYSYAAEMGGLADREDVRLRFDVLTKTRCRSCIGIRRRGIGRRMCGCFGWRRRCCGGWRRGCSTRSWGGSARSVSSGRTAGRGGEWRGVVAPDDGRRAAGTHPGA